MAKKRTFNIKLWGGMCIGSTINIGDAVVAALRFCMMHPFALPCSRCVAFGCMSRSRCDVASFVCVCLVFSSPGCYVFFFFRFTCLFAWWPPRGEGPSSGGHQANIKYNMERRTQGKQQQKTDCSMFLILKCSLFGGTRMFDEIRIHYMCKGSRHSRGG